MSRVSEDILLDIDSASSQAHEDIRLAMTRPSPYGSRGARTREKWPKSRIRPSSLDGRATEPPCRQVSDSNLFGSRLNVQKSTSATWKLRRARILASTPYVIGTRRNPDSRCLIYFVASVQPTPLRISAVLGDTIHNLRSALDHLAYQLVSVGTDKPPSVHVCFPIAEDRRKYTRRRSELSGARPEAIAAVDALMPFKGGNDTLWRLNRLDNVDKHRALITAGSAFRSVNIGSLLNRGMQEAIESSPLAGRIPELPLLNLSLKPADRLFPLKTGDELFIDLPDAVVDERTQFHFEVAFGEEGVVMGEPIIETVGSMMSLVEGLLPTFARYFA